LTVGERPVHHLDSAYNQPIICGETLFFVPADDRKEGERYMPNDYDYHINKKTNKTYVTKRIETISVEGHPPRLLRIASKVVDTKESHAYALERGEVVLRVSPGGREEIIAKFYEDDRDICQLVIQKFSRHQGRPLKASFSFRGDEIRALLDFLVNLKLLNFLGPDRINVTDQELHKLLISGDQLKRLVIEDQDTFVELARSRVTTTDLIALGYRRKQLERFKELLDDQSTDEMTWQNFFEANRWVFGYGLTYVWTSGLTGRKLEQVVAGNDIWNRGKRADAVLKTKGAVEALCFVEIKKHSTPLLKLTPYRPSCWAPSDELTGGVVQSQVTVEMAIRGMMEQLQPRTDAGDPTGEELFAFHPRTFLVIGSLAQLKTERGVNRDRYRSFELYRRNTARPEIITFDELYERATAIVQHEESLPASR
jgi:Domain of unknown function (DUF4263)